MILSNIKFPKRAGFSIILSILFYLPLHSQNPSFKEQQHRYPRVRNARVDSDSARQEMFIRSGIGYPPARIYLRVLKHERIIELWARNENDTTFKMTKEFSFTAYSGELGPKRAQGDLQIPEGFYFIDRFNAASEFHLSLGINYPNLSDRIRANNVDPGGDIFIHGNQVTIGCIPIGDKFIEVLYVVAVDAKDTGNDSISVHIFPCKMTENNYENVLKPISQKKSEFGLFWEELKPIYDHFEKTHRLPAIKIDEEGKYKIQAKPVEG